MNTRSMGLRGKLLAAFGGLAAISLLVIGVALYSTLRWQTANAEADTHFRRSLLLQGVRASTFQALKEVDDGLTSDHVDARADFEAALEPADRDFRSWAALADTESERREVALVRAAYLRLVNAGREVFNMIPVDRQAATRLVDDQVDTKDLARFRAITVAAVEADLDKRETIARETRQLRETAQVMLAISGISTIALMMLIAAYLTSDLFRPLRSMAGVLDRLADGDRDARVDDGRADEIGDIARGINRVADAMQSGLPAQPVSAGGGIGRALHARLATLRSGGGDADWAAVEQMAAIVARATPRPAQAGDVAIDLAALLHAVVAANRGEIERRGLTVEQSLPAPAARPHGDAEAIAAALAAMVSLALDRLPDRGGRMALRAYVDPDTGSTQIEVADDAVGGDTDDPRLEPIRQLVRAKGGAVRRYTDPESGSVTQLTLA